MIECIRVGHADESGKGEPGFTRKTPNADLLNAQGDSIAMNWFLGQRIEYRILRVPCFCVKRAGSFCIVVTFSFLVRLDYAEQESIACGSMGVGTGGSGVVADPCRC